jgi:peptidoglycan/xylan/chitin deacetylase (PgdA/CDA1 family)
MMGGTGWGLPVLTYHALDESGSVIATTPRWFARTLGLLRSHGFEPVDLQDWVDRGRPDVPRGFAIAFDDGLASIRRAAEPLAKHGSAATAFLVAGLMGKWNDFPGQLAGIPRSRLLGWGELPDLASAGFRFGAHGYSHRDFRACDDRELDRELALGRALVEEHAPSPCRLLAYPYGSASSRERSRAAAHCDAAFATRLDLSRSEDDPMGISRIDAYYLRSERALRRLLEGRLAPWLALRRGLRAARKAATRARA